VHNKCVKSRPQLSQVTTYTMNMFHILVTAFQKRVHVSKTITLCSPKAKTETCYYKTKLFVFTSTACHIMNTWVVPNESDMAP